MVLVWNGFDETLQTFIWANKRATSTSGGDVPVARGWGWLGLEEIQCILTATTVFGFADAPHAHLTAVVIGQCPATAEAPAETAGEHHLCRLPLIVIEIAHSGDHTLGFSK